MLKKPVRVIENNKVKTVFVRIPTFESCMQPWGTAVEVTESYELALWGKLIGSFSFKTRPFCAVSICAHASMLRWSCKNIWLMISHFSCSDSAVEDSLCIWEWLQIAFSPDTKRKDCIGVSWFQTESRLWTDVLLPTSQVIPSSRAPEHSKHW